MYPSMSIWSRRRFLLSSLTSLTESRRDDVVNEAARDDAAPSLWTPSLWSPFFLRRKILLTFIAIFLVITIVLAVLFGLSTRNQGICSANSNYYYLWVYGPTAVFTAVAAFWAQVEYRSKQMMPWVAMAQQPQPVKKSLLLDYVDPMNILSLYHSAKQKHFIVTAAISGTLLIQLATVLSSGLFFSNSVVLHNSNAVLTAWEEFGGSFPDHVGSRPASTVFGVLNDNLSYPNGTTDMYAYQWFNSSNVAVSSTTGVVDIFSADLECEVGNVTNVSISQSYGTLSDPLEETSPSDVSIEQMQAGVSISTDSCTGLFIALADTDSFGYNGSVCTNMSSNDANRFVMLWGEWNGTSSTISKRATSDINVDTGLFTEVSANGSDDDGEDVDDGDITISDGDEDVSSSASAPSSSRTSSVSASSIIKAKTTIKAGTTTKTKATTKSSSSSSSYSTTSTTSSSSSEISIGGYTFTTPSESFSASLSIVCKVNYGVNRASVSLSTSNGTLAPTVSILANSTSSQLQNITAWDIMKAFVRSIEQTKQDISSLGLLPLVNITIPQKDFTSNPDTTQLALSKLFRMVSAQFADIYLKDQISNHFKGTTVSKEPRLYVQSLSFGLSVAALVVLMLCTGFLYLESHRIYASRDPSSIGGLATILARSDTVVSGLKSLGASNLQRIEHQLRREQYATNVAGTESSPVFRIEHSQDPEPEGLLSPPLAYKEIEWYRPFAVSISGRALILSAPVALILVIEGLFQYSQAHDGITNVSSNIFVHYSWTYIPTLLMVGTGQLYEMMDFAVKIFDPYHNMRVGAAPSDKSIMDNYLAKMGIHALFSAARKLQYTVTAAAFTTVLTPFLTIVVSGLLNSESAPIEYTTVFQRLDLFYPNMTSTGTGLANANLVLADNLTDPQWTYNNLTFPKLKSLEGNETSDSESTLEITIPAVRGVLNCTESTHSEIYCSDILGTYYLAWENSTFGARANDYFSGDGYFGHMNALDTTDYPKCPHVIVSFGRVSNNTIVDVNHLSCTPYVEQVDVDTTFKLPGYTIDTTAPPQANESTKQLYYDGTYPDFLTSTGYTFANPLSTNNSDEDYASLFPLVIYDKDGVPASELVGQNNTARLLAAVENTYAQIMAQVLNADREDGANLDSYNGIVTDSERLRLKQSAISTRILEALLGALFLCAVVTFCIMDTRKVLPKNPCSIAAVASLLAGSELLSSNIIPEGAEWMDDKELEQKVFSGLVFSLGWWADSNGSGISRFGIDVGGAKEE